MLMKLGYGLRHGTSAAGVYTGDRSAPTTTWRAGITASTSGLAGSQTSTSSSGICTTRPSWCPCRYACCLMAMSSREQRKSTRTKQTRIYRIWDEYDRRSKGPMSLLSAIGHVYRPWLQWSADATWGHRRYVLLVSFSCVWVITVGVASISLGVCMGTGTNCQVCISVSGTTQPGMGKGHCYVLISWDVLLVTFLHCVSMYSNPVMCGCHLGSRVIICFFFHQGVIRIYVSFSCVWVMTVGVTPISLGVCMGTGTNCQVCISVSVTTQPGMGKDDSYVLISWDVLLVTFSSMYSQTQWCADATCVTGYIQ